MDNNSKLLTRSVENILPNAEGLKKLISQKKIRVYLGVDPTGSRLHLGHTIPLRKLNEFAQAGHESILVIGTGTVLAGDPSQRAQARTKITQGQIDENIKTWKEQVKKIVDLSKVQIRQNGEWLLKLGLVEILDIASHISSVQLYKREMFQRRIEEGNTVWSHETLYPLLQGYDSVALDVDLEIGGTDQTFNMLIGRELQKKMKNREKFVLTTPLINGADGKPMSKSSGNCIWLDDTPGDMFGKIMALADSEIESYWKNLTDLPESEFNKVVPMAAKKTLAHEIVKTYHGRTTANEAQNNFERVIQQKQIPESIPTYPIVSGATISQILINSGLAGSVSESKRLVDQGAVSGTISPDSESFVRITDPKLTPQNNFTLKKGSRDYLKIIIKK